MNVSGKRVFLDTNILLYYIDAADPQKHRSARQWVEAISNAQAGAISWQVLNEFYANAIRKFKLPSGDARQIVATYDLWNPIGFDLGLLRHAWQWIDDAGIPYWDALILAAAERADCTHLLSEDFQAGRQYGAITVVNPFLSSPEEFFTYLS